MTCQYMCFFQYHTNRLDQQPFSSFTTNRMLASNSFLKTLESWLPATAKAWVYVLTSVLILRLVSLHYHHGLHKYNGPFLASFSDLWRLCYAYRNSNREPMIQMHDMYGDVVRMGPNVLSFSQPQAIEDIYGPGKHFKKVCMIPKEQQVSVFRRDRIALIAPPIH